METAILNIIYRKDAIMLQMSAGKEAGIGKAAPRYERYRPERTVRCLSVQGHELAELRSLRQVYTVNSMYSL